MRKIVPTPAESLYEIYQRQLEYLAVVASQRLFDREEQRLFESLTKAMSAMAVMSRPEDKPQLTNTSTDELLKLASPITSK